MAVVDEEENFGEFEDIEKVAKEEEQQPQEKLNLISLGGTQSMSEAHMKLQKLLKKERQDGLDESSIIRFDDEVLKEIAALLNEFKEYNKLEKERKEMLVSI